MKEKKELLRDTEKIELQQKEVNIYAGCGEPRIGCLVDCLDHSAWLSTAH